MVIEKELDFVNLQLEILQEIVEEMDEELNLIEI